MRSPMLQTASSLIASSILSCAPFLAQETSSGRTDRGQESNPLAGPSIADESSPTDNGGRSMMEMPNGSIVEQGLDGSVISVGPQPDLAALLQTSLTAIQRERLDRIRIERGLALSKAIRDHYREFLEIIASFESGEAEKSPALMVMRLDQLARIFNEYFRRGSFITEMRNILSPRQRWEALTILGEYRRAQIRERRITRNDPRQPWEILLEIRLEEFGQLIQESFEARAAMEGEEFQKLIDYLLLTPAQVSQVEAIYQDIAIQSLLDIKVDAKAQLEAFAIVHDILTPEQRAKFRLFILRGGRIE